MSKTNPSAIKERIETDDDFIFCHRMGNSLAKLIGKHPDGLENDQIAKVLMMTEEEVEQTFQSAIKKLRSNLKLKTEED